MDIFAHALWTIALAKFANFKLKSKKSRIKLNIWLSAFFGIAPDIFSFGIWFVFMIFAIILGGGISSGFHDSWNGTSSSVVMVRGIVSGMYNITHSMVIFLIVFGLVYLWKKRVVWEMLGWALHILIDIPSHSYQFYPTPFLWPVFDWKFDGWSWGNNWFMIINYSLLAIAYLAIGYFGWKETKKKIGINKKQTRNI